MSELHAIRHVAVVLFDDFAVLDAYGPIQAFGSCRRSTPEGNVTRLYQIFTLGMRSGSVRSGQGPATQIDHTLADAPYWDVLVVPGGSGTRPLVEHKTFVAWLRQASERSPITATVCTGSALLARTGLLDGRKATTNKIAWDWVVRQGPRVNWQRRARWVEDGNIISSSGVSAGTDMALALIGRLNGRDMAASAARHMEHVWNQDSANDPFA